MPGAPLPVVIAGGGIGGLAAALALARHGIASVVCERRATFEQDGAGIQIGPNGTRILTQLGVSDRLQAHIAAPAAISVHATGDGRALARLPLGDWIAQRHGAPYWTAHRQDLHAALLEAARADRQVTLLTGTEIVSFADGSDHIEALTTGGRIAGRALIAADGLWSRLKGEIATGAVPFQRAGKCAFRSVVERGHMPDELSGNDVHVWLGTGSHAVHYPVRSGRDVAIVIIVDDPASTQSWNTAAPSDWQQRHASAIPPLLRAAVEATQSWRMWSLVTAPELAAWTRDRAALLGDAAHPVLPFLAQGAVLALEDAVTIAARLAETPNDAPAALRAYALDRRRRALAVARASASSGRIYHLDGVMKVARDGVLKSVPPTALMARYDWLYGWRAKCEPSIAREQPLP